jgi:ABC-2 type transport system permease protein
VTGANLAIAMLFGLLLPVIPGNYAMAGSLLFGLALCSVGLVFAGVAAVTAQLTEYSRGASAMAVLVFGAAYVLRAIGDVTGNVLSWLSPIGWAQATRIFVDERWFPLLFSAGFTVLLIGTAFALLNRRDVAAGLIPQKPGPENASGFLSHPVGFALRQQLGSIVGWSIGLTVLGIAFGSIGGEIEEFIVENPQLADYLAAGDISLLEAFIGLVMLIMALLATGFAIQSAMRARNEEMEGRAEPVLATAVPRTLWFGSYLLISMAGSVVILLAGGIALGGMAAADQRDYGLLIGTLGAALTYIPVIWMVIGFVSALFGLMPRLLALPWLVLIYGAFVGLFGDQVQLPGWMFQISPFEHVPALPGGPVEAWSSAIIMALAILLLALGQYSFRRRDLEMS